MRAGEKGFRRVVTSWVLIGTIVLAMWLKSLGDTFEIVGAVGSNTICLIMPGINYCLLFWTRKDKWWFLALSQVSRHAYSSQRILKLSTISAICRRIFPRPAFGSICTDLDRLGSF